MIRIPGNMSCNAIKIKMTVPALLLSLLILSTACTSASAMSALETLYLSDCPISDPSVFAELTGLKRLGLNNCGIVNLDFLYSLPDLIQLRLEHNSIADIAPILSLSKLEHLSIAGNRIYDLTPLVEMNLEILRVFDD